MNTAIANTITSKSQTLPNNQVFDLCIQRSSKAFKQFTLFASDLVIKELTSKTTKNSLGFSAPAYKIEYFPNYEWNISGRLPGDTAIFRIAEKTELAAPAKLDPTKAYILTFEIANVKSNWHNIYGDKAISYDKPQYSICVFFNNMNKPLDLYDANRSTNPDGYLVYIPEFLSKIRYKIPANHGYLYLNQLYMTTFSNNGINIGIRNISFEEIK